MNKEIKRRIKEATDAILEEEKIKSRFLKEHLDGNYLQYIINRCDANPDLVCEIRMKDGTTVVCYTKKKVVNGVVQFNDTISPEDVR